jgi:hypothetical protein
VKKVCSAKDDQPIGEVVYEKDGYAIHKIDGEEHKVRTKRMERFLAGLFDLD